MDEVLDELLLTLADFRRCHGVNCHISESVRDKIDLCIKKLRVEIAKHIQEDPDDPRDRIYAEGDVE